MSARYRSDLEMGQYNEKPSKCSNFLHYSWKTISCLVSHVTLIAMVVSYCVLGAYTFSSLERDHEQEVKRNISKLRHNVTKYLWKLTTEVDYLEYWNFTNSSQIFLKDFENALIRAMHKDGWDGDEDTNKIQWSSTGALFYSIIVITTIGYGHIAPKTTWGKIVTIFYAILGIPLMLLCLSSIGDIMATSFRFLYWRVCCYACTKKPKKKRNRSLRSVAASRDGKFSRSRNTSFRRSMRTSTRSADSGFGRSELGHYSHSDTELRIAKSSKYHDELPRGHEFPRGSSMPRLRPSQTSRYSDTSVQSRKSPNTMNRSQPGGYNLKGGSLDRRKFQQHQQQQQQQPKNYDMMELDPILLAKTPILCNKYVVGENELSNRPMNITTRDMEGQGRLASPPPTRRAKSVPRSQQRYLEPPGYGHGGGDGGSRSEDSSDDQADQDQKKTRPKRKKSPPHHNPSPKMMTPLGYGHRNKYLDDPESDDEEYYDDDGEYIGESQRIRIRPVPIWLCVFLVVSYIIAGAFLFNSWENWNLLDAAYFCFITLTTIGFGDLVPAKGVTQDVWRATVSIALCSLYLLFGIALLAMSFNLVQEEVIANVKSVAKRLGIIKKDGEDSDDEDD